MDEDIKDLETSASGDEMAKKIHKHYGTTEAMKIPISELCKDMSDQVGNKNVKSGENNVEGD